MQLAPNYILLYIYLTFICYNWKIACFAIYCSNTFPDDVKALLMVISQIYGRWRWASRGAIRCLYKWGNQIRSISRRRKNSGKRKVGLDIVHNSSATAESTSFPSCYISSFAERLDSPRLSRFPIQDLLPLLAPRNNQPAIRAVNAKKPRNTTQNKSWMLLYLVQFFTPLLDSIKYFMYRLKTTFSSTLADAFVDCGEWQMYALFDIY